ncbi:MAG: hypothetical protein HY819_17025 [Acidobacteria bacterium]|nr:hypothetical protein [Acidobacteriota bacterium]
MLFIKKLTPLILSLFLLVSLSSISLANISDDEDTNGEAVVESKRPRRVRMDSSKQDSERNGVSVSRNRKHGIIRRYSVATAKGTAKGTAFLATGAAKGTAEGATGAAKGTSVAATSTAYATSVAAKKTAKATTIATKAVIGAFK